MNANPTTPKEPRASLLPLALGLALAVLAGVITLATLQLRGQTRRQIASRDAEIFHAVALMHADDPEIELLGIGDPVNQLAILLKTSSLKAVSRGTNRAIVQWRVIAARLFDPDGRFVEAFPNNVLPGKLSPQALPALRQLEARASYYREEPLSAIFTDLTPDHPGRALHRPILEINVPLHTSRSTQLAGVAQFLIEAQSMAAEFEQLDRNLLLQAFAAFVVSGGFLSFAIAWAFRRLRATNKRLAEQAEHLWRANMELALAAKTNALGAVTAHLLHGLKNPLCGVQNFMTRLRNPPGDLSEYDHALASTRRMQAMINQVVSILRENEGCSTYEVTAQEIMHKVAQEVHPLAQERGARLDISELPQMAWTNRVGQLTILVLGNLLQNALQASPRGGVVRVEAQHLESHFVWRVLDQGPGFPKGQEPFTPCQSLKEDGSGIGLALSKQLANHLQASLDVAPNHPTGCVFSFSLPRPLAAHKLARATSTSMR